MMGVGFRCLSGWIASISFSYVLQARSWLGAALLILSQPVCAQAAGNSVLQDRRPIADKNKFRKTLIAAQRAMRKGHPRGPYGVAAAYVFAFADRFTPMLCHLARSVEAAGGWLHVLGLRDGQGKLPWGELEATGSKTREDEPWHFEDKSVMMKKHIFLAKAIRDLPANVTVVFVDGFDVLFQRPLTHLVAAYHQVAHPVQGSQWPVVYGGEKNCWPFPHTGSIAFRRTSSPNSPPRDIHRIPADASLSADHHGTWRFRYGDRSPWSISGKEVCSEWLLQQSHLMRLHEYGLESSSASEASLQGRFPFFCAGTFVGTAVSLRRLMRRLFVLFEETREYHDQALLMLLLLRNRSLGFVDTSARIFLGLHGHDEFEDLERPLCRGNHFVPNSSRTHAAPHPRILHPPVPRYKPGRSLEGLSPPGLQGGNPNHAPPVLHFNGNGKRHYTRCVEEFQKEGILGGRGEDQAQCTFFDVDRRAWQRYR